MKLLAWSFFILMFLCFLQPALLFAQSEEVVKLLKKVENSRGKDRIELLSELSKNFYNIDPVKGIAYGRQALLLADSLRLPSMKSKAYTNIGVNYWGASDFMNARKYYDSACQNAMLFKDSMEIALIYNRRGLIYESEGKFDSSMMVFKLELELLKRLNNPDRLGTSLQNIGTIHLNRGEFKSAITYLLEAKKVYEDHHIDKSLPFIYLKLGQIYSETKEYATARRYFQKGIDLSLKNNDLARAGIGVNALGILYKNQENYDSALMRFREALEILKNVPKSILQASVYSNMGNVYLEKKDYHRALQYHTLGYEQANRLKMPLPAARARLGMGQDLEGLKNYTLARTNYEAALQVFIHSKTSSDMLKTYESLIKVNKLMFDYGRAVYYYDAYVDLKDSLNRLELNIALDSLKVAFHTEQTERENDTLVRQSSLQEKTIRLQQIAILSSLLAVILLVAMILLVQRSRRNMKRINTKLLDLSAFKDSMTHFLVHDLKNALNAIVNFDVRSDPEYRISVVRQSGKRMLTLVHNLLDIGKFENNRMEMVLEDLSVRELTGSAIRDLAIQAGSKQITILNNPEQDFVIRCDSGITERILVNLLDNAIRYSPAGARAEVSAEAAGNRVRITVRDHGEGIPDDFKPFIFEKYAVASHQPDRSHRSYGLGLAFCKMAVEAQGGEIGIESAPGRGTSVWFTLPLVSVNDNRETETFTDGDISDDDIPRLTAAERDILLPVCAGLRNLTIHQISDIRDLLHRLENADHPGIQRWKKAVELAVYNCNPTEYQHQIDLICNLHEQDPDR